MKQGAATSAWNFNSKLDRFLGLLRKKERGSSFVVQATSDVLEWKKEFRKKRSGVQKHVLEWTYLPRNSFSREFGKIDRF